MLQDALFQPGPEALGSAYLGSTPGSTDLTLHGKTWSSAASVDPVAKPTQADVLVARIGNHQTIVGVGGYLAPRS